MRQFLLRSVFAFVCGIGFGLALMASTLWVDEAPWDRRSNVLGEVITDEWLACVKGGGYIDADHGWACFETRPTDQIGALIRGTSQ